MTGPTGSGKTTTLYSALNEIKSEETKIITTEDPIEYQLDGINQIQVHPKVGLTFAASLRSILRHDPDVVLVGEIRDLETAENAMQASLTGHLVFSTLHTNDAAGAFMRLCRHGRGAVPGEQHGRRRAWPSGWCARCARSAASSTSRRRGDLPDDFPLEELIGSGGRTLYRAVGCRDCRGTGYCGRVGIYELLVANDEIRHLASERLPSNVVKQAAMEAGMRTLRQDGWDKVLTRRDDVDEVLRVTKEL